MKIGRYVAGVIFIILPSQRLLLFIGMVVLSFLKFEAPATKEERNRQESGRPLSKIIAQPRFVVSVLCAVGSYALMSFVMTGAPLAMAFSRSSLL